MSRTKINKSLGSTVELNINAGLKRQADRYEQELIRKEQRRRSHVAQYREAIARIWKIGVKARITETAFRDIQPDELCNKLAFIEGYYVRNEANFEPHEHAMYLSLIRYIASDTARKRHTRYHKAFGDNKIIIRWTAVIELNALLRKLRSQTQGEENA